MNIFLEIDGSPVTVNGEILNLAIINPFLEIDGSPVTVNGEYLYLENPENVFSRAALNSLPIDADDLLINYSPSEISDVGANDNIFVDVSGAAFLLHQFKLKNINNTSAISIHWSGKTTHSPTANPVYLQIFNQFSGIWETLTYDNYTSANTEFSLTSSVVSNVSDYYDDNLIVCARIYQFVGGVN